jgi:hypothetical protein
VAGETFRGGLLRAHAVATLTLRIEHGEKIRFPQAHPLKAHGRVRAQQKTPDGAPFRASVEDALTTLVHNYGVNYLHYEE